MVSQAEVIEGEILEAESRQLVVSETVSLPVPVEEVLRQWEQYQRLTRELLDDSDYQKIGNKRFKKKSAWRKYARAFNITDRVTFEDIPRSDDGFPRYARVRVEARAINGRTTEADQECHVNERCCEQPCRKQSWKDHECCPATCDGKRHWSHPGDLPATALTRAKNRAISDLIGAGEVSAEEMQDAKNQRDDDSRRQEARQPSQEALARHSTADLAKARGEAPSCPDHGPSKMSFIPAGKNAKGEYGAFWSCKAEGCNIGRNKKGWSIFDEQWKAIQEAESNREPPMSHDEAFAAMPDE